jgi:hypothetical protein
VANFGWVMSKINLAIIFILISGTKVFCLNKYDQPINLGIGFHTSSAIRPMALPWNRDKYLRKWDFTLSIGSKRHMFEPIVGWGHSFHESRIPIDKQTTKVQIRNVRFSNIGIGYVPLIIKKKSHGIWAQLGIQRYSLSEENSTSTLRNNNDDIITYLKDIELLSGGAWVVDSGIRYRYSNHRAFVDLKVSSFWGTGNYWPEILFPTIGLAVGGGFWIFKYKE